MPSQRANDSATEASAGTQTRPTCSRVGIPTIRVSTSLSRRVSRRRRRRVAPAGSALRTTATTSAREDRPLLFLDLVGQAADVLGVADEALQRRDHHREGEEVEVVLCRPLELLADEHAEPVHAGLLVLQRLGRVLPGAAERALLVVGEQLAPG